jgi:Arc/MetJ-type ribon-helix-helix transcriptional regulator
MLAAIDRLRSADFPDPHRADDLPRLLRAVEARADPVAATPRPRAVAGDELSDRRYVVAMPGEGSLVAVRKVAVTLPGELFDMVERLREIEHRSRSEVVQEALRHYFGQPVYEPTEQERGGLDGALMVVEQHPEGGQPWAALRDELMGE